MNRTTPPVLRILSLLLLTILLMPEARSQSTKWESSILAFQARDKVHMPPPGGVVFVGSSTIRIWKTLATDFPRLNVIDRGFGGSELADSVYYADRIIIPYRPRMVVLFAGTNDIADGKTPQQVFTDFKAFVAKLQTALPRAKIDYIEITSPPSRWKFRAAVTTANRLIKNFCATRKNLKFIAVRSKFFGPDGHPRKDLFRTDQLHLNAHGYRILANAVRPFLPMPKA